MQWITNNWELIAALLLAIINILNALTPHFSAKTGWRRYLLFIFEMLSVVVSRNCKASSIPTWLKMLFQSTPPVEKPIELEDPK